MPEEGFFDKHRDKINVAGPSDCWLWTAARLNTGYGAVWVRGKMRKAHREAYEAENGEGSADGLVVRHRCDTPACVNPAHLELGTQADNYSDMVKRGRQVALKGEAHGCAKLTEADVAVIRAIHIPGSRTHSLRALARKFGVNQSLIGKVVHRDIWTHVL